MTKVSFIVHLEKKCDFNPIGTIAIMISCWACQVWATTCSINSSYFIFSGKHLSEKRKRLNLMNSALNAAVNPVRSTLSYLSVMCSAVQRVLSLRAQGTPDPPTGTPLPSTCSPVGRWQLETSQRC